MTNKDIEKSIAEAVAETAKNQSGINKIIVETVCLIFTANLKERGLLAAPDHVVVPRGDIERMIAMKDNVTKDCDSQEWSLWATDCLYAGNYCLVRKGKYIDHTRAWDDAAIFINNAAEFFDEMKALIAAIPGEKPKCSSCDDTGYWDEPGADTKCPYCYGRAVSEGDEHG